MSYDQMKKLNTTIIEWTVEPLSWLGHGLFGTISECPIYLQLTDNGTLEWNDWIIVAIIAVLVAIFVAIVFKTISKDNMKKEKDEDEIEDNSQGTQEYKTYLLVDYTSQYNTINIDVSYSAVFDNIQIVFSCPRSGAQCTYLCRLIQSRALSRDNAANGSLGNLLSLKSRDLSDEATFLK